MEFDTKHSISLNVRLTQKVHSTCSTKHGYMQDLKQCLKEVFIFNLRVDPANKIDEYILVSLIQDNEIMIMFPQKKHVG